MTSTSLKQSLRALIQPPGTLTGERLPRNLLRPISRLLWELTRPGRVWDLAPRPNELKSPRQYYKGVRLWRTLKRDRLTMLSCRRGRTLHRLAAEIESSGTPGILVDCGVWNGGSTVLLSTGAPSRPIWAFDSFEEVGDVLRPLYALASGRGASSGSEAKLREAVARFADPGRLQVVTGWFSDTFHRVAPQISDVALIHCDTESYSSVLSVLETFYPKLSMGGYTVINTYGHWESARRATDDFRRTHRVSSPLVTVNQAVYWRRT
jgi:O-methyltransferase